MPCVKPLHGWVSKSGGFTLKSSEACLDLRLQVSCGQCIQCRLSKTRNWAIRILHESGQYEENCFLTLTYNDANLPGDFSINKRDPQLFLKRLRKYLYPKKIRYFLSGEYGDINNVQDTIERLRLIGKYGSSKLGRPHYHAIVFNYWPEDAKKVVEKDGYAWYESDKLESIWRLGFIGIGQVEFKSAAYTAKYATKKMNGGEEARFHYKGREPEWATMSRGGKDCKGKLGGIGCRYLENYEEELWNNQSVVSGGREYPIPDYYKNKLKKKDSQKFRELQWNILRHRFSEERLEDIEKYFIAKELFFENNKI